MSTNSDANEKRIIYDIIKSFLNISYIDFIGSLQIIKMQEEAKKVIDPQKMKNFIKQRRMQMKAMGESQEISEKLTQLITSQDSVSLLKQLKGQTASFLFGYLLSQDQLLRTPIVLVIQQPRWYELLTAINAWSKLNITYIRESINLPEEQQTQVRNLFLNIIRALCKMAELDVKKIVKVLSEEGTIFAELMKAFLTYENIVALMPENRQLILFEQVFAVVAAKLQLKYAEAITKFATFKRRDKIWKQSKFIDMITTNPEILTLKEMNYNFMHELALKKDEKLIYQIFDKLKQDEDNKDAEISQAKETFFCAFDSGGETPLDIVLSKWQFQPIKKLLQKAQDIECIHLSIGCLNKVICNRRLNETQVQALVEQLLDGEIASRGYSEQVTKEREINTKRFKGLIKRESSDYVIVLDRRRALMAKDKRQSYPLLNYLDRFMGKCSLKTIMKLFFPYLQRKTIKAKVISALTQIGKSKHFQTQNEALKELQQIIYYHQALLQLICKLPHTEILEFFIDKLFINFFTISIWSKVNGNPIVEMVNRHFFTNFIHVHGDLGDNVLNRKILAKVFQGKDDEKFVGEFNFYVELLRQFFQFKELGESKEWMAEEIKKKLKEYFTKLEIAKFDQLQTFFYQGKNQRLFKLREILAPVFTTTQILTLKLPPIPQKPALAIPQQDITPEQLQKRSQQKQQNRKQQIINKYKKKRNLQNFDQLTQMKIELREQSVRELRMYEEKIANEKEGVWHGLEPRVVELEWSLELDQPDLECKMERLLAKGFKVRFNTNRLSIMGKDQRQNNALNTLNQPWKTIAWNMLKSPSRQDHKSSLLLHIACFVCRDQDVNTILNFLQSAPTPFLHLVTQTWPQTSNPKHPLNPTLLLTLLKSSLAATLKLKNQETIANIITNIRAQMRGIVDKLKVKARAKGEVKGKAEGRGEGKGEGDNFVGRMGMYRQLFGALGEGLYRDNVGDFQQYVCLHSQAINLAPFLKQITAVEIVQNYGLLAYLTIAQASASPYKLLTQVQQLLNPIKSQILKIRAHRKHLRQSNASQDQPFPSPQTLRQFHLHLPTALYTHSQKNKQEYTKLISIFDKLSPSEFNNFITANPPVFEAMLVVMVQRLRDQERCLRVLEVVLRGSLGVDEGSVFEECGGDGEANVKSLRNLVQNGLIRCIRPKYDKLNSAIAGLTLPQIRTYIRFPNPPSTKSTLSHSEFLKSIKEPNYQIYLQYLHKMLLLPYIGVEDKLEAVLNVFGVLYNGEEWGKGVGLVEKLGAIRGELVGIGEKGEEKEKEVGKEEEKVEEKIEDKKKAGKKIDLITEFLMYSLDLIVKNRSRESSYKQKDIYQALLKSLLTLTQQKKLTQNQPLFQSIWHLNPEQACKIVKLDQIDLLVLARCLAVHPEKFKLLGDIAICEETMPLTYKAKEQGRYLPLSDYSVNDFGKLPYLVDLMIFEEKLRKKWAAKAGDGIKKYQTIFDQKKKCVFMTKQVMDRYNELYSEEQLKKYSPQIFTSNTLQSLKSIPKAYLEIYFAQHKEIRGISNLKQNIIKQLIEMGHLNGSHLFQIIKASRLGLLEYFIAKTKVVIDYGAVKEIQGKVLNVNSSFVIALLYLENQGFVGEFVRKFKIFQLYPEQEYKEMIRDALWAIALLQRTAFLKILLQHLTEKTKGALKFAEAPVAEWPNEDYEIGLNSQTQQKIQQDEQSLVSKQAQKSGFNNETLYLPIRIAIRTNFYEYLFLLLQQKTPPAKSFKISNRFLSLSVFNPQQYSFIPLMKKKLELLKLVYNLLKGLDTKLKSNQLLMEQAFRGVFLGDSIGVGERFGYFLGFVGQGVLDLGVVLAQVYEESEDPDEMRRVEQVKEICKNPYLMIAALKTLPDTQIPDESLMKIFPQETKIVSLLLKQTKLQVKGHHKIHRLIQHQQLLRDLLYIHNPKYLIECSTQQPLESWSILFSHAFSLQVRFFQLPENLPFTQNFIHSCYFAKMTEPFRGLTDEATPFDYRYNEQKVKDILVACLVSKYEGDGRVLGIFCEESGKGEEEIFLDLAVGLCVFKRFDAGDPLKENNIRHNYGLWNSILQNLTKISKLQKFNNQTPFTPFYPKTYQNILQYPPNKPALQKCIQPLPPIYAALSHLSNLLSIMAEQHQIQQIVKEIGQPEQRESRATKLVLRDEYKIEREQVMEEVWELVVHVKYEICGDIGDKMRSIRVDHQEIKREIEKSLFWEKLGHRGHLIDDQECLSKMKFDVDVDSLKKINSISLLKSVMGSINQAGSLAAKITEYIKELNSICEEQKDGKVYSLSDVFGPVVINDQTDKSKVLQCLSFYQFCKLPQSTIQLSYTESPPQKTASSLLSDLKQYIRYFSYEINDDQSQNKTPYKFSSSIFFTPKRNNPEAFTILYGEFYINNIVRFLDRVNKYGREISATFNSQVLFKYSVVSIMEVIGVFGGLFVEADDVFGFLSALLNCRRHIGFVEEILLMISEDANNIMKAVKGILLIYQYSPEFSTKGDQKPYKINDKLTYSGLDYKIDDQMFKIYLRAGPTKKETPQLSAMESNLISRKDFLSTVFSSTEFLTGYFMNKSVLANELVKSSKEISRAVNSMVNISINYRELENFIDKVQEGFTIKQIDGFLTNLNTYISSNYVKFINTHLNSRELAIEHQVSLIKCFQKLNAEGSKQNSEQEIRVKVQGDELGKGITQIYNFASELKTNSAKESNIKNMYLIQIYKNYFASVVREGMSCILGFKTNKPTLVIQLQKKQDIDKVNITELSFLLLISNRVPTNDEISHNKIIKIFVTDLNENVYEINRKVREKLLALPEESDDRTLANMVPVIQSNIILGFSSEFTKDRSELKDDQNHRHLELALSKQSKFKIKIKNKPVISCIDMLKIDVMFNNAAENLSKLIKGYLKAKSNFTIKIRTPKVFEASKAADILNMAFLDVDQLFSNLFFEPPRNRDLEIFASAELGEDIRENLILRERKNLFQQLYEELIFQLLPQGDSKMKIQNKSIKIFLAPKVSHTLNSTLMSDTLLKDQIDKVLAKSEKVKKIYDFDGKVEELTEVLDHLLIARYQIQTVERALDVLKKASLLKTAISGFKVQMRAQQKSMLLSQKQLLLLRIRLKTPKPEYFPSSQIMQFILNSFKSTIDSLVQTKYNFHNKCIEFYNYDMSKPATLVLVGKDRERVQVREVKLVGQDGSMKKACVPVGVQVGLFRQYFVVQREGQFVNLQGNYFWQPDPNTKYISQPQSSMLTKQPLTLLLKSPTPISMNECNINTIIHLIKNQKPNDITNITKSTSEYSASIQLLSKQIMKLEIVPFFSQAMNVQLGRFRLVGNQGVQGVKVRCTSGQAMVQERTKFVELVFRNKVVKPYMAENQRKEQNATFSEPAEKVMMNQIIEMKEANVEQMVYIVNEHARKFLTRAGEARVDVINVCDEEGNAINWNPATKVYFRHLNIDSQVIVPEVKCVDNTRVQLKWTPTIRGPYEVFLNNTRLNPNYQIGVCAAFIDIKSCKAQIPKKTDLCFMEQTECSLVLKDNYGNIYTELEESIINDELIIQISSEDVNQTMIKTKADKIDKYGLKKIRFSIDDPSGSEPRNVRASLTINMEKIVEFQLKIKGQSLGQRRKNLEKEIESVTKRFYVDISVSRNNFMESLFTIAEKSLDKSFSVKFAGEQGIDAGGLKRQFYDMIGKQMKDPQKPFFIQTDMSRHNEYFINPEIMKNKKKSEYMSLFGKFLANSMINTYLIGINFSPTFVKLLYEDPITFEDMLAVLPKQEASRYEYLSTADADYIEDLQIYFSCILNRKKGIEVEMIQNGKNIKVTKQNVKNYLQLLPEFLIVQRYKEVIDSFRAGFESVFPLAVVRKWIRTDEFWCMTAGVKEITPEIVLNYTVIRGGKETHHAWFRAYITEASQEILQGFLKFSSGSSSIDFYQTSKITVQFETQGDNPKKLPISHTCWKQIEIPAYKSFAIMKQLLNAAFLYCSEGFGFG